MSNVAIIDPKTRVEGSPTEVLVTDSVTHQAGDGKTAGMSPSQETADIFDNSPQATVKTQVPEDAHEAKLSDEQVVRVSDEDAQKLQQLAQSNANAEHSLHTLSDGSVDIDRDR